MSICSEVMSFAVVAGLVTVTPGMDTALVLRASISQGARHAFATALGINTGALVWGVSAALGVSAVLATSQTLYTLITYAGAVYMVWLGIGMLRRALQGQGTVNAHAVERTSPPDISLRRSWSQGLFSNLLNPKIGFFYMAMLPQFIPDGVSPASMGLLLALVHDLEGLAWFSLLIVSSGAMSSLLRRPIARRVIDGVTGTILVTFGIKLGLSTSDP